MKINVCSVFTKHPQVHAPVGGAGLVGHGAVEAAGVAQLNPVHSERSLGQQSEPKAQKQPIRVKILH